MSKPILYQYFRSSASYRVRIALAFKGIDYESRPVNLIKDGGQQNTDEYKAINPMGQVPTLVIDGATLTQSLPIIEYLEETRPEKPLLPSDPIQRAHARRLAEIVNAGIQPIQNLPVLGHVEKLMGSAEAKIEWAKYFINRGFAAFEKELTKTAGKYCLGDNLTIADLALVPQVYNAKRFNIDMSRYPTISRVMVELEKHEAVQAADPIVQEDCPEDLRK